MLVDEITIRLEGGRGGDGAIAFNKVRLMQGPTGADGGRGGNVYFEGVRDVSALGIYASRKIMRAEDGKNGRGQFVDGRDGEDLVLKIPIGTRITNEDTGFVRELDEVGQRILAAGGGTGGRGNFKYRSSINTTPRVADNGTEGDVANYHLELRLIADVGLVGLPNAGKSSLLNELTGARSKVGDYSFTTLEPHLGSYYGLVIADIPGLIEGASEGKGLGVKFLRHVERTRTLFHLISAESDDPVRDHAIIKAELESYSPVLARKEERVFLTKCDMLAREELDKKLSELRAAHIDAQPVTILEERSLDSVRAALNTLKDAKREA